MRTTFGGQVFTFIAISDDGDVRIHQESDKTFPVNCKRTIEDPKVSAIFKVVPARPGRQAHLEVVKGGFGSVEIKSLARIHGMGETH